MTALVNLPGRRRARRGRTAKGWSACLASAPLLRPRGPAGHFPEVRPTGFLSFAPYWIKGGQSIANRHADLQRLPYLSPLSEFARCRCDPCQPLFRAITARTVPCRRAAIPASAARAPNRSRSDTSISAEYIG